MKIIDEDGKQVGHVSGDTIVFDPPVQHGQYALGLDIEMKEGIEQDGVKLIQSMDIKCLRAIAFNQPAPKWHFMDEDPPEEGMDVVVVNPVRNYEEEGDEVIVSERGQITSFAGTVHLAFRRESGTLDDLSVWDLWWSFEQPEPPPIPRDMIEEVYRRRDARNALK